MTAQASTSLALFDGHFRDRRVIVTGAAGGIGLGIASAFANAGGEVHLVDLSPTVHEVTAGADFDTSHVTSHQLDITDESAVRAFFEEFAAQHSGLDVLVNNAGLIRIDDLENTSVSEFEKVLSVNTTAAFLMIREALPLLSVAGGSVINAASGQSREGFVYTPSYAASKFGIVGMSQSLAKELAPRNIRVNCYCPGIVQTDMWDYNDREWGRRLGDYAPGELISEWISGIPLGRPAEADDVSALVMFLASDAARYITGQAVNVDGGMFMN